MEASRRPIPPDLERDLRAWLGSAGMITEPGRLLVYEGDALTTSRGTPTAVLLPGNRAELLETVRLLHEAGQAFVPRGSGTGLSGGSVAHDAVVLVTTRLNRILDVDPGDRTALVEPGVLTAAISAAAADHGLRYLPDPASAAACTIGGNVAMNSGGPHCLKHGVTSDHVLGLEIVRPDGSVAWVWRGEDGGLDSAGLFIGSEGTIGVVSAVLVGLVPVAADTGALLALFDGVGQAGAAVSEVFEQGLVPVALELIDRSTIEVVEASIFAAGLPTDTPAALVIECEGDPEDVDADLALAAEACRALGATDVRIAESEEERLAIWQARKKAYGALGRAAPDVFVQDAVVPRTELARLLPEIEQIARDHQLRLASFFHAGDGNLHPNLLFDRRDPDQVARVESAGEKIMRLCVEAGGSITGEHGVGSDKVRYMPLMYGPDELRMMHRLHDAFDPDGLANPDKLLPRRALMEETQRGEHIPFVATDENGLVERLRMMADPPVVTGTDRPDPGPWFAESGSPSPPVVSTAGLADVHSFRPRDLTIEVGAGMRMARLQEIVEEERLWIPIWGIGSARSVGGWVAAASPTPWDAAHGPIRRQLLGCRVVAPDGTRLAWGRAVMKNVAGYDMPRLMAGSRGRLGVITRVTLRLWPRPEAVSAWTIRGAPDGAGFERIGADALEWRWNPGNGETVVAVLAGSASSVRRRESRLRHRAREQGAEIRETDARSVESAAEGEEAVRDGSIVYRLTPGRRYLPQVFRSLVRGDGVRPERIGAMPVHGAMLVRFGASAAGSDGSDARLKAVVGALEPVAGRARPTLGVERGHAIVHAGAEALREPEAKAVEAAIDRALGAWPRVWQSDYL